MKLSTQSRSFIASTLKQALKKYTSDGDNQFVTDILLMPVLETGELVVLDDDENELGRTAVEEWADYGGDKFYGQVESVLRSELLQLKDEGFLNRLSIMKPYSYVLVDEDKETVSELLLVDEEETLFVNDELLKGLDEELNAFLKELLEK